MLPVVENCYDMGNLAAVCRSADGAPGGGVGGAAGAFQDSARGNPGSAACTCWRWAAVGHGARVPGPALLPCLCHGARHADEAVGHPAPTPPTRAAALGFGAVHVVRQPREERYKQSKRSSAGADKWLDVQVWDSTQVRGLGTGGFG